MFIVTKRMLFLGRGHLDWMLNTHLSTKTDGRMSKISHGVPNCRVNEFFIEVLTVNH
jgi:hypothetical protein